MNQYLCIMKNINIVNKEKINSIIIDKLNNTNWKSIKETEYGNYNNCLGNEYVEIKDTIANHYIICGVKKHDDYMGKNNINLSLEKNEDDKVIFKLTNSDNLYLIISRGENINIALGSFSTTNNTMIYNKLEKYNIN